MTATAAPFPFQPGPNRSPARGTVPIRAFFFDTYGTACDFFEPCRRAITRLAQRHRVDCDAAALAIA